MPLEPNDMFPVMCLTQDGTGVPHSTQVERLCAEGARWIQLRMKGAGREHWLAEATAAAGVCREHGAVLIVNDSAEVALASGAAGAHLGGGGAWAGARSALGPGRILGGTVNTLGDARRAVESGCLDYVGVGPLRFTATKGNLSPILGIEGVRGILRELRGLPAWVIGGVEPRDLPLLRDAGAAGVAVSSSLHNGGRVGAGLRALLEAWDQPAQAPGRRALVP